MREVGIGLPLERFELITRGDVYCVVEIVDRDVAPMALTALPGTPLELAADKAREFVAAWRQHAEMEPQAYDIREAQAAL
jgi:hypothetical protein